MRQLAIAAFAMLAACASSRPIEVQTLSDETVLDNVEPFEVRLSNFGFQPQVIHLTGGQAYRLTLRNDASSGHSFTAPDFFEAARISPSDAEKVSDGEIEIAGRSTETVELVPTSGTYELKCTHFGHAALGMTGTILVD